MEDTPGKLPEPPLGIPLADGVPERCTAARILLAQLLGCWRVDDVQHGEQSFGASARMLLLGGIMFTTGVVKGNTRLVYVGLQKRPYVFSGGFAGHLSSVNCDPCRVEMFLLCVAVDAACAHRIW